MKEVFGIGDNFNDVSMIRDAGIGVAMGNAPDEVKAVADFVTDTNVNGGGKSLSGVSSNKKNKHHSLLFH